MGSLCIAVRMCLVDTAVTESLIESNVSDAFVRYYDIKGTRTMDMSAGTRNMMKKQQNHLQFVNQRQ